MLLTTDKAGITCLGKLLLAAAKGYLFVLWSFCVVIVKVTLIKMSYAFALYFYLGKIYSC